MLWEKMIWPWGIMEGQQIRMEIHMENKQYHRFAIILLSTFYVLLWTVSYSSLFIKIFFHSIEWQPILHAFIILHPHRDVLFRKSKQEYNVVVNIDYHCMSKVLHKTEAQKMHVALFCRFSNGKRSVGEMKRNNSKFKSWHPPN